MFIRKIEESPYRKPRDTSSYHPNALSPQVQMSPSRRAKVENDIEDEKYRMRETKADLAKELENETNRRL